MRELTEASKEAAAAAVAAETEDATGIESSPPSSAEGLEDGEQDQNTSGRQAVVGETTAMVSEDSEVPDEPEDRGGDGAGGKHWNSIDAAAKRSVSTKAAEVAGSGDVSGPGSPKAKRRRGGAGDAAAGALQTEPCAVAVAAVPPVKPGEAAATASADYQATKTLPPSPQDVFMDIGRV